MTSRPSSEGRLSFWILGTRCRGGCQKERPRRGAEALFRWREEERESDEGRRESRKRGERRLCVSSFTPHYGRSQGNVCGNPEFGPHFHPEPPSRHCERGFIPWRPITACVDNLRIGPQEVVLRSETDVATSRRGQGWGWKACSQHSHGCPVGPWGRFGGCRSRRGGDSDKPRGGAPGHSG